MRAAAALLVLPLLARPAAAADPASAVYDRACAWCHGADGRGDGPAAFSLGRYRQPRPRDFVRGRYKLRSTPSGQLPADADLLRTLEHGIPGAMPSFAGMPPEERQLAVAAVKRFDPRFAEAAPTPIRLPPAPALDAARARRGARIYAEAGCPACHGESGRGDGSAAAELKDETGLALPPADLRYPARMKGGASPEDLYRTLATGFDGTPMPAYGEVLDEAQLWDLVAFVRSLRRR